MADKTRTLPSPSEVLQTLRKEYMIDQEDMERSSVTIQRNPDNTLTIKWVGGLVHDLLSINGDLCYLSHSSYWGLRARVQSVLGDVHIEDWDNNEWRVSLEYLN